MNEAPALRQRLDARIRLALDPPRFPERRDVELAFSLSHEGPGLAFLDHFWLGATRLWVVAARVDGSGLDCAIAATGLRQVLRALAAELLAPALTIAAVGQVWGGGVSALVVASFDTADGSLQAAALGDGCCDADGMLEPGNVAWLAIGRSELPQARHALEGLQSLVDGHGAANSPVLAAIEFKAAGKNPRRTTLTVRNDRLDIVEALAASRRFLDRHHIAEAHATALELMLDELLTNQVNYGFRDGLAHEILVNLEIEDGVLAVELRDDGVPFDPLQVAPPDIDAGIDERQLGGLGMHFVRSLVDDIAYRRSGGWNVLALTRRLDTDKDGEEPA